MDNKELTEYDGAAVANELPGEVKAPEEFISEVRRFSMQMMGTTGPQESSVAKKITEEHITKMLALEEKGMETQYKENNSNRIFMIVIAVLLIGLVVTILVLFRDKTDMVEKILYAVGGLMAGFGGGYGFSKSKRSE